METLQEFRYPFISLIEFFAGGYWLSIEGLHLTLGWIGLLLMSVRIFSRNDSLFVKLSTIYFAAFIFNNYAYSWSNIRVSEFCGIFAAGFSLKSIRKFYRQPSLIGYAVLTFAFISLIHTIIIAIIYPDLNQDIGQFFIRVTLFGKIFVLGLVALSFDQEFNNVNSINQLIQDIVSFGLLAIGIYIVQIVVLLVGYVPFGTFLDAGFTGFPSFGSVSIERGHFAKLFVPLFPFYAICLIEHKKILIFSLYLLINLINFSVSGQIFLICYLFLFAFYYVNYLLKWYNYFLVIFFSSFLYIAITNFFSLQVLGVFEKINKLGFQGDEEGGRGFGVLEQYLNTYPLGISYSGSTLRTATELPEINLGIYAFISQFSVLSIPLIIGFIFLNYLIIIKGNLQIKRNTKNALLIGILVSGVIYFIDILWFTPTIWLPLIIYNKLSKLSNTQKTKG